MITDLVKPSGYGYIPIRMARSPWKESPMKTILLTSALLFASAVPSFGQTQPVSTGSDDTNRSDSSHHGYGWIGLLGLAGLVGLRRQKSVEHQRMAASGVKVSTVPVHLPE